MRLNDADACELLDALALVKTKCRGQKAVLLDKLWLEIHKARRNRSGVHIWAGPGNPFKDFSEDAQRKAQGPEKSGT